MKESIQIDRKSRLYEVVHRGYEYNTEAQTWFYSKAKRERLEKHSTACFKHAHRLFARELERNNIEGWDYWRIGIVGRCTNGDFWSKRVNFQFVKRDPRPDEQE